jgi:hypothetical protein
VSENPISGAVGFKDRVRNLEQSMDPLIDPSLSYNDKEISQCAILKKICEFVKNAQANE